MPLNIYKIWGSEDFKIEMVKSTPFDSVFDPETDEFLNKDYNKNDFLFPSDEIPILNISADIVDFIRRGIESNQKVIDRENILLIATKI